MSFNIALLCKNFGFLTRLFCPAFLLVTWSFPSCSCRLCSVWWRRFLKSPHKVENASELQLMSIPDQYLLYVLMYSWVYNGAPQQCFPRCMVDYTLITDPDNRPDDDHFFFPFYMGSCTRRLNLLPIVKQGRTSSDFNENQPKHQNRNFLNGSQLAKMKKSIPDMSRQWNL